MKAINFNNNPNHSSGSIRLLPILAIGIFIIFAIFLLLFINSDHISSQSTEYLIPWVVMSGVVIAAPSAYLYYKKQFSLFNPLVFAAWTYFFPAFFIGGLILAGGFSNPYFLSFIQDPKNDLPLTMIIVMLGYGGLTIGYLLPIGKKIGEIISSWLPNLLWSDQHVFKPGYYLLALGLFNTIIGFVFGVLGYQKVEEINAYDGLIFLVTFIWLEASFLLWLLILRRNKFDSIAIYTAVILIITALAKAIYAGNRGGLLSVFIMIMMAYLLSGRKISGQQVFIGGLLLALSIIIGMVYGTTFRNLKETESRIGMEQYTEHIFDTVSAVVSGDNLKTLEQGFSSLAERLDAVSSLAVVVSNHEKLKPFEESYGLDNNIWKDTATFFIPRIIWQEKPLASEPRKYGELYFNFGENSFTITPMGDLLRNFGIYGVPIGMIFLGMLLRTIFESLVGNTEFSYWKRTLYFMLLTAVSYESFYGSIIPYISKVAVISIIGIFIVNFIISKSGKTRNG